MIKNIAFDVGGVLAIERHSFSELKNNSELGIHGFMVKKLGLDMDSWFDSIDWAYSKSNEGKISKKEALFYMSNNVGVSSFKLENLFLKAYKRKFRRNNELFNFAFSLKEKYKISILSDQWHVSKDGVILSKDVKKFDSAVFSCDVGFRKPNPKIFELALKKAKISSSEMLFIDNREWNVKSARKLGIKSILYKNNKQLLDEIDKSGVLR